MPKTVEEIKRQKERLETDIINAIFKFSQEYGVEVTGLKGIVDKDFGIGVTSVVLVVTL